MKHAFVIDGPKVYLGPKEVGWVHISKATNEIRAEVKIGERRIIALGSAVREVERRLDKAYHEDDCDD